LHLQSPGKECEIVEIVYLTLITYRPHILLSKCECHETAAFAVEKLASVVSLAGVLDDSNVYCSGRATYC